MRYERLTGAGRGGVLALLGVVALAGGAEAADIAVDAGEVDVEENGQCSLIEALENANGGAMHADCAAGSTGADSVVLATDSVYTLSAPHSNTPSGPCFGFVGLPRITTTITVRGRGATVERAAAGETPEFRLFAVDSTGDLTLEDLTVRNGKVSSDDGSSEGHGGGICTNGILNVRRSTLTGNSAIVGGAISGSPSPGGRIVLLNSTVSDNHAGLLGAGGGGGIGSAGELLVSGSVIHDNSAPVGGGILVFPSASDSISRATIRDSTLSANSAELDGGAIFNGSGSGPVILTGVTLSDNSAGRAGGGIWVDPQEGQPADMTLVRNTVVANSTGGGDCAISAGASEIVFDGVNVVEDGSCGCVDDPSCRVGDPGLGELGDHGGPTLTHALLPGSIAIDVADDTECSTVDQRGVERGIDATGDGSPEDLDGGCDLGAFEAGGFGPWTLAVDSSVLGSDGNGILEPAEAVAVVPSWRNLGAPPDAPAPAFEPRVRGTASAFSGPGEASYSLIDAAATYDAPPVGDTSACSEREDCYIVALGPAVPRPVAHWDASLVETLDVGPSTHAWSLHVGDSFVDVPRTSPFYGAVETLLHNGVTGGCTARSYCPAAAVSRGQMSVFVLRASGLPMPPPCTESDERFADVPFDNPFCPWIEELARRWVTAGCGGGDTYCPASPVTRAQMAVFLLKALGVDPQSCDGTFADVPCASPFAPWIEELAARGITAGCAAEPAAYCPASPVTRAQMAAFTASSFELGLYGP